MKDISNICFTDIIGFTSKPFYECLNNIESLFFKRQAAVAVPSFFKQSIVSELFTP